MASRDVLGVLFLPFGILIIYKRIPKTGNQVNKNLINTVLFERHIAAYSVVNILAPYLLFLMFCAFSTTILLATESIFNKRLKLFKFIICVKVKE